MPGHDAFLPADAAPDAERLALVDAMEDVLAEIERLRAALADMIEFVKEEFDSDGGRWSVNDDDRMKAAKAALAVDQQTTE